MLMFHNAAMAGQHGHVLGQCAIIGNDRAGIAHRAQILAGIKRIGRRSSKGADLLALVARQMRLRAILDYPKLVLARDRHDRVHIRRLAIERCTGMTPTVRGVIAASIAAGSIVKVASSVSANTTVAPACVIIDEVLIQECAVVMTSSPG